MIRISAFFNFFAPKTIPNERYNRTVHAPGDGARMLTLRTVEYNFHRLAEGKFLIPKASISAMFRYFSLARGVRKEGCRKEEASSAEVWGFPLPPEHFSHRKKHSAEAISCWEPLQGHGKQCRSRHLTMPIVEIGVEVNPSPPRAATTTLPPRNPQDPPPNRHLNFVKSRILVQILC